LYTLHCRVTDFGDYSRQAIVAESPKTVPFSDTVVAENGDYTVLSIQLLPSLATIGTDFVDYNIISVDRV